MKNKKHLYLFISVIILTFVLSGCAQVNEPINAESTGIWNQYFVYPLSTVIIFFANTFKGSYGLAIVVVTLIVRLFLVPLNVKQVKSSMAMQKLQPEIKELQKKYSSKDQETQQKLQKETMALFQKHGANPLAGCLPIFVQMPVFIALYHAIMRTEAIKTGSFLWFELGSMDPVLPIIAGAATFYQQKLMMADSPASDNPQMKMMLYMMPIMITVFAFFFPAALALYWVVGNIFMVAQTLFIRRPMLKQEEQKESLSK